MRREVAAERRDVVALNDAVVHKGGKVDGHTEAASAVRERDRNAVAHSFVSASFRFWLNKKRAVSEFVSTRPPCCSKKRDNG